MAETSNFDQCLFDDHWEKWEKLVKTNLLRYLPHIFAIPIGLLGAFIFFVAAYLKLSESDPVFLIMAGVGDMIIIYMIGWSLLDSEEFNSIKIYPWSIQYLRFARKEKIELIFLEDIKKIQIENSNKKFATTNRKTDYKTFLVEVKNENLKRVYHSKKPITLHVKHHEEFISTLRQIYGEEKWKEIFVDET